MPKVSSWLLYYFHQDFYSHKTWVQPADCFWGLEIGENGRARVLEGWNWGMTRGKGQGKDLELGDREINRGLIELNKLVYLLALIMIANISK